MYRIGQFRKTQLDSYSAQLDMVSGYKTLQSPLSQDIKFVDACGNLSGNNILVNPDCYYLQFGIRQRNDSEQSIHLKIVNTNEQEDNEQSIEDFVVPIGSGISYFETIISPNGTYNQIVWELQRIAYDYRTQNPDGTSGRTIDVSVGGGNFTRLVNVLNYLKTNYSNLKSLVKIGVQGPPSLLMCINREPIRIGKTGIYEINNDIITITSISFVPKTASDYFIMDFQY